MLIKKLSKTNALIVVAMMSFFNCTYASIYKPNIDIVDGPNSEIKRKIRSQIEVNKLLENEIDSSRVVTQTKKLIESILKANGYYANHVNPTIIPIEGAKQSIFYKVKLGPQYIINSIKVNASPQTNLPDLSQQKKIKVNDPLIAQDILSAGKLLAEKIEELNCFTEVVVEHLVILDHINAHADVEFNIKNKPQVKFGDVYYQGFESVSLDYVKKKVPWEHGDCFKISKVRRLETKLMNTNLFSRVKVEYPLENRKQLFVPTHINVNEKKHRTIKIGTGFESDKGPGIYLGWQHRNISGLGRNLNIDAQANSIEQSIVLGYQNPEYARDKNFSASSEAKRIISDQYHSNSISSEGLINYKYKKNISFQYGLGYRLSEVKEFAIEENFGLLYLPIILTFDSRTDPLDPRDGMFYKVMLKPYWDTFGHVDPFFMSRVDTSFYVPISDDKFHILAIRFAGASLIGPDLTTIPADLRFYAGGGHSVRGYEYQLLGTIENEKSRGGRSLFESSFEYRAQLTDKYGLVAFIDGGNVFEEVVPNFDQSLRFAAGVGFRYFTSFGPLRVDLAFPINKREIDKSFQFYISIGQSF